MRQVGNYVLLIIHIEKDLFCVNRIAHIRQVGNPTQTRYDVADTLLWIKKNPQSSFTHYTRGSSKKGRGFKYFALMGAQVFWTMFWGKIGRLYTFPSLITKFEKMDYRSFLRKSQVMHKRRIGSQKIDDSFSCRDTNAGGTESESKKISHIWSYS